MRRFYVCLDASLIPYWIFYAERVDEFPPEFQAFDTSNAPHSQVVWVTDTTQALVAYDWLLEHGWEYAESRTNDEFTRLLARDH